MFKDRRPDQLIMEGGNGHEPYLGEPPTKREIDQIVDQILAVTLLDKVKLATKSVKSKLTHLCL